MKHIIKNFNNSVKKTIFKVQNKTNNNFHISILSRYLIIFIVSLFIYLFYVLIPILYDKKWIQTKIESKLLNEFKINISTPLDISYRILPAPHFLIKDSKIIVDALEKSKSIAEVKDFQIFLNHRNLFDKEKIDIKTVVINGANFSLLRSDLKLLNDLISTNFSNKKIKINKSNIFFKDNLEEIISIIKIDKTLLFFNDKKLSNFINLNGEIFNIPFTLDFNNLNGFKSFKNFDLNLKSLKLHISNKSTTEKKVTSGINSISFFKSKINTNYNITEKIIDFKSTNSLLDKSQFTYDGELSINPFDLNAIIYLDNFKISKLFNINPILIEFIKSGLLFNDNISINISIIVNSNIKNEIFHNAKINFNIINGKIHFDKTKFINDDIGSLQLNNSNLFYKNDELLFNSDMILNINNSENLFSLLNTNKSSRKNFKNILINFDYNFLKDKIKFNSLKIDDSDNNSKFLNIIDDFNANDLNNYNKSRRIFNDLLKAYEG